MFPVLGGHWQCLGCVCCARSSSDLAGGCFWAAAPQLWLNRIPAVLPIPLCGDVPPGLHRFWGAGSPPLYFGGSLAEPPKPCGSELPPQEEPPWWGQLVCHRGCFLVTAGDTLSLRLPPRVPPCPPAPHGLPSPVGCGRVTSLPPLSPRPAPPAPSGTPQRCPVTPIKFFCHSSPHPWGHGGWGGPRGCGW